ncbi:MAG: ribosomal L7Ae/L30e/S12e/Gadd45 family protein [Clostridia bacterium]|nr:ribosomal L7Ae/L30e/S12e/Gadd45 family protein [Clostridia bacterium]
MNSKLSAYFGFATKSRNLVSGYNTVLDGIARKKVKLVVVAKDVSENSKKKLETACREAKVKYLEFSTIEELSKICGQNNKGIFGINDNNFSEAIVKEIENLD